MEQGDTAVEQHQEWDGSRYSTSSPHGSPRDLDETAGFAEPEPDTADLISREAPDPPPAAVTDPDDPSCVEPAPAAVRVNPDLLLPPGSPEPDPAPAPPPLPSGTVGTSLPDAPGGHA